MWCITVACEAILTVTFNCKVYWNGENKFETGARYFFDGSFNVAGAIFYSLSKLIQIF